MLKNLRLINENGNLSQAEQLTFEAAKSKFCERRELLLLLGVDAEVQEYFVVRFVLVSQGTAAMVTYRSGSNGELELVKASA